MSRLSDLPADRGPALRPPPGQATLPRFDRGWCGPHGAREPYLSYVGPSPAVNWSVELEELHREDSRDHFIDIWNRRAIIDRIGSLPERSVIIDLGCAGGFLLDDLRGVRPDAQLIGVDLIESGLRGAHALLPDARLLLADVCALPLDDASVDLAVSANLLEHVPDDVGALGELRRVLRPGARAVLVVPAGPGVYDYYDRFLGHERRYARGELAGKARLQGLEVVEDLHLGSLVYPPFWLMKKYNRLRYRGIGGQELEARVAGNISSTRNSSLGRLACEFERGLLRLGVRLPFGIRGLTVVRRPAADR